MSKDQMQKELSKCQSLVGLFLCIVLANFSSSLTPAEAKQTVESLPDGNYFYGESSDPRESGADYVVFRKINDTVIGVSYKYQTDAVSCFQGKADQNAVTNMTVVTPELGNSGATEESDSSGHTMDLTGFNKLRVDQAPQGNPNLQKCLQRFADS